MIATTRVPSGEAVLAVQSRRVGDGGANVLFAHATGFCGGTWQPVVDDAAELGLSFEAITFDQRGHGGSTFGTNRLTWWDLGKDVLAVLGNRKAPIGVGHSSGGAALVLAELLVPGTFQSLLLFEPIIPPPPYGREEDHHLARLALKRTWRFDVRADALERFRRRGPFAGWDDRVLAAYLECGLTDHPDGGLQLACAREVEAEFYRSVGEHGAFERIGELRPQVSIMYGAETQDFGPEFYIQLAAAMPNASATGVLEASHFLPMERPELVAQSLAGLV